MECMLNIKHLGVIFVRSKRMVLCIYYLYMCIK